MIRKYLSLTVAACTIGASLSSAMAADPVIVASDIMLRKVVYNPDYDPNIADSQLILPNPDSDSGIFLKNVSQNPELASAKAKMNSATVYVPAQAADGTALNDRVDDKCVVGDIVKDADGTADDNVCQVLPIVVTYAEEAGSHGASDAFLAVSLDDGATYRRYNLSRSADLSSFTTQAGEVIYGDSAKPVQQIKSNLVAVSWSDKYCTAGQPAYTEETEDGELVYADYYGVAGSQGSIDYDADPETADLELGEVPYSCVWASRAVINKLGYLDPLANPVIQVYKAERLTSGVRDSLQIFMGGGGSAGFAASWQEDPDGLRPGSGAGPGHGFSGATTNNQTDIWYSWIGWGANFTAIDTTDEPTENEDGTPRVRALYPFSVPVRITDNASCNEDNYESDGRTWCSTDFDGNGILDYCASFAEIDGKNICVSEDGRLLNGDTGASRPNLFLQPYTDEAGVTIGAWAFLAYEETKGLGEFVPDYCDGDEAVLHEDCASYWTLFSGKDVYYHSFDFKQPETIAAGLRVNGPYKDEVGETTYLEPEFTTDATDSTLYPSDARFLTENARRIRFIPQGAGLVPVAEASGRTPLLALWKQGMEGKGGPSDIMLARISAPLGSLPNDASYDPTMNPYAAENFTCTLYADEDPTTCLEGRVTNMSAVTVTETEEDTEGGVPKATEWTWTCSYDEEDGSYIEPCNLLDESYENPYDNAIAHRGAIRGAYVAMGFSWTPNWAAARNANDVYNFYVRRSFDGGQTWTTDPNALVDTQHCEREREEQGIAAELECTYYAPGEPEPPRNVSLLKNNDFTIVEPRIVSPPGTIKACKNADGVAIPCLPEDKMAANVVFVSYGTAVNADQTLVSEEDDEEVARPADLFYARSTDYATTYEYAAYATDEDDPDDPEVVWDWTALAKDSEGIFIQQGEAQLRSTPAGNKFFACWLEEEEAADVPTDEDEEDEDDDETDEHKEQKRHDDRGHFRHRKHH